MTWIFNLWTDFFLNMRDPTNDKKAADEKKDCLGFMSTCEIEEELCYLPPHMIF